MSKHTEGPWAITETKVRNGYELLVGANMQKICAVYGSTTPLWDSVPGITTGRANARLIAAAPDLLAQLKIARTELAALHQAFIASSTNPATGVIEDPDDVLTAEADQDMLNGIDAAIAKAEGGAA